MICKFYIDGWYYDIKDFIVELKHHKLEDIILLLEVDFSFAIDNVLSTGENIIGQGKFNYNLFFEFISNFSSKFKVEILDIFGKRFKRLGIFSKKGMDEIESIIEAKNFFYLDKERSNHFILNLKNTFLNKIIDQKKDFQRILNNGIKEIDKDYEKNNYNEYLELYNRFIAISSSLKDILEFAEINYNDFFSEIIIIQEDILAIESKMFATKNGCFIATATMGDYNHPVVMDLRLFRDNWLLKRKWGVQFTKWYYTTGPKAARVIEKSHLRRKVCYFLVIKPLHFISKTLK